MEEIQAKQIDKNFIRMISEDWFLVGACKEGTHNMMCASWGMIGHLWNKNVMNVYIRPTRYTYEFIEESDTFSCSFFDESYRKELTFCGTKSGREFNKSETCHFTTTIVDNTPVFDQASYTIICRKIAQYDLDPSQFIDNSIDKHYKNDYHRVYIGEIIKVLKK